MTPQLYKQQPNPNGEEQSKTLLLVCGYEQIIIMIYDLSIIIYVVSCFVGRLIRPHTAENNTCNACVVQDSSLSNAWRTGLPRPVLAEPTRFHGDKKQKEVANKKTTNKYQYITWVCVLCRSTEDTSDLGHRLRQYFWKRKIFVRVAQLKPKSK